MWRMGTFEARSLLEGRLEGKVVTNPRIGIETTTVYPTKTFPQVNFPHQKVGKGLKGLFVAMGFYEFLSHRASTNDNFSTSIFCPSPAKNLWDDEN